MFTQATERIKVVDMFPYSPTRLKTAVDQVGQTVWKMTYFLSSRARWFKKTYHHRYFVNVYFLNLCTGIKSICSGNISLFLTGCWRQNTMRLNDAVGKR